MTKNPDYDIEYDVNQYTIEDGLTELMIAQQIVSGMVPGAIKKDPTNSDITEVIFALNVELAELAQELGWKSWKENKPLDVEQLEKIAGEFGDVLAFLGMLMILMENRTGLTPAELCEFYIKTCQKNINRFSGRSDEPGYGPK